MSRRRISPGTTRGTADPAADGAEDADACDAVDGAEDGGGAAADADAGATEGGEGGAAGAGSAGGSATLADAGGEADAEPGAAAAGGAGTACASAPLPHPTTTSTTAIAIAIAIADVARPTRAARERRTGCGSDAWYKRRMREPRGYHKLGRRDLVLGGAAALVGCGGSPGLPSRHPSRRRSPLATSLAASGVPEPIWGVQSGEITPRSAVVWSRSDRPGRMLVEWSTDASFANARAALGGDASLDRDLTAVARLVELPPDERIHYRVRFDTGEGGARGRLSPWLAGSLRTPQLETDAAPRDVVFAWSGDVNGQGWGIDPARGGMPAFTALLDRAPELFICCGDAIYADDPIREAIALPDGSAWNNIVVPAKSRVAQTLDDFRGAFLYSRLSAEVRALSARVPTCSIWDDHEVRNNWFPGQQIDDPRYAERSASVLATYAARAMREHAPVLGAAGAPMFRSFRVGPLVEVFLLDGRSHRTPNEPVPEKEAFLGEVQLAWLEAGLARSTATWKVIACDMPIGLVVSEPAKVGGGEAYDGFANTSGPPRGRELELARLLSTMKRRGVKNVVWLTADVHYAAAHRYDPARADLHDMDPFWEFVAGPMHASSFPRKALDATFGPEVAYASADDHTVGSPADPGTQSFGVVRVDGASKAMTVTLVDGRGRDLHTTVLRAEPRA